MPSVDIAATTAPTAALEPLAELWTAMVATHRRLSADRLPVRDEADAWELRRAQYRRWLTDGSGILLTARTPDRTAPSGYAFLRVTTSGPTFDFGERVGEVESLAVAEAARGRGIGTALLRAAAAQLHRRGCTYWSVTVLEDNRDARRLYERVGFGPWLRALAAPVPVGPGERPVPAAIARWDRATFGAWLADYERLWRTAGTAGLADLFAEQVSYRPSPWREPVTGLAAVADFWERGRDGPGEDFVLSSDIVAVDGSVGVVRVDVRYADGTSWRDLWIVEVDATGRCIRFEEWPFAPSQPDGQESTIT